MRIGVCYHNLWLITMTVAGPPFVIKVLFGTNMPVLLWGTALLVVLGLKIWNGAGTVQSVCVGWFRRPSQSILDRLGWLLVALLLVNAVEAEIFYWHNWCSMQRVLVDNNRLLASEVWAAINGVKATSPDMYCYADFGTLLQVLRHTPVHRWDPDTDFSCHGGSTVQLTTTILAAVNQGIPDAVCTYYPARTLVQCVRRRAHSDIWLWSLIGNTLTLQEGDGRQRLMSAVVPMMPMQWTPGSGSRTQTLLTPRRAHVLMKGEYGDDYMTPIVTRWECTEMIVKGIATRSRVMWRLNVVAIVIFGAAETYNAMTSA